MRDLDQAQRWYERDLQLMDQHDTLGRAITIGQLGNVALERFNDARDAGADQETLLGYLNDAIAAYSQKLDLLPADEVNERAVSHNQLGIIYAQAGHTDRALAHYSKSIQYKERAGDTYSAGGTRFNAALVLARAGRAHEALLYARAALRDWETLGSRAAAEAEQVGQIIARLERELSREPDSGTGEHA